MPPLDWQPWHTAAFLDAQRRRRPVLLLLETAWAPACAEAHDTTFARDDVRAAIADTAVPVRVDADRRPDIADRYGLGHWPSVLVLTPEGHVLTGGTRLDASLAPRLREAAAAFARHEGPWTAPSPVEPARALAPDVADLDALALIADAVWRARDARSGTFAHHGVPCAQATRFAFAHAAATGDGGWFDAAVATLETLRLDTASPRTMGLVAPAAAPPGTMLPVRLDDQAGWIRVYARALQLEHRPSWAACLDALLCGLRRHFRRDDGHWRPWTGTPPLVLVDASARAGLALLAAADALQQPDLARDAIDTLEVLAPRAYARGAGVAHVLDGTQARGPMLLDDAMLLAQALLDADAWREGDVYRDLAEELIRTTLARLREPDGGLGDRVASLAGGGRVGRLAEPHLPLVGNAAAARLLVRLFPGDEAMIAEARRTLLAVTPQAVDAGVLGAPVALAWHALGPAGTVAAVW